MFYEQPRNYQPCPAAVIDVNAIDLLTNLKASKPSEAKLLWPWLSPIFSVMKTDITYSRKFVTPTSSVKFVEWAPPARPELGWKRPRREGWNLEFCFASKSHDLATTFEQQQKQGSFSAFRTTTMAEDALQILVKALRDHDLPCDREAIKSAFADPESKTTIQAWVEEYLSPETLLTKDEANL